MSRWAVETVQCGARRSLCGLCSYKLLEDYLGGGGVKSMKGEECKETDKRELLIILKKTGWKVD